MQPWLLVAAVNGFIVVALGAIGSHALQGKLTPERLAWLDTGLRYHMVHALALLAVAVLMALKTDPLALSLRLAAWGFLGGIVLFSGGLYLLALASIRVGPVVPVGGLLFLAGWIALAVFALGARA